MGVVVVVVVGVVWGFLRWRALVREEVAKLLRWWYG
jgi:hypothetical protein